MYFILVLKIPKQPYYIIFYITHITLTRSDFPIHLKIVERTSVAIKLYYALLKGIVRGIIGLTLLYIVVPLFDIIFIPCKMLFCAELCYVLWGITSEFQVLARYDVGFKFQNKFTIAVIFEICIKYHHKYKIT